MLGIFKPEFIGDFAQRFVIVENLFFRYVYQLRPDAFNRLKDGVPDQNNVSRYRMIRMPEAPRAIDVHFVHNDDDPTGMGEPPYPPTFAALANALYRATGKRIYNQPYIIAMTGSA